MSALNGLLIGALNTAYADSEARLYPLLLDAENQLKEYSLSLPLLPDYSVSSLRDNMANKRVELWTKAISDFLQQQAPIVAGKIADTVYGYLQSNNSCIYTPGSLIAPGGSGGPVVSSGGAVAGIVYE
jgi:hypothetical protein